MSEQNTNRDPLKPPYLDRIMPESWKSAQAFSLAVKADALAHGLSEQEGELIKVRASQLNGCAFCLDLHSREARESGITQQKLDLLPAWRETGLYTDRERAALAIAEATTRMPVSEDALADLVGAREILGDESYVAAEWVAVAINAFNRVSILSHHPVRPRDAAGKLVR